jgi:hypothetical protein
LATSLKELEMETQQTLAVDKIAATFTSLVSLRLKNCPVVDADLRALVPCKSLRELALGPPCEKLKVTAAAIEQFKRDRPDIDLAVGS